MKNQFQFLFATCLTFLLVLSGCKRPADPQSTLGSHTLTIVDTSGKTPSGGNFGTRQDDVAGTTTHSYNSANGRYKITLENDVLTINGETYPLSKPGSEIRIVDDRVEINGAEATPSKKSPEAAGKSEPEQEGRSQ